MLSDTIHERMKGWFARILLGLIIISFALFGVDAYFKGGGGQWVAEVDRQKISSLELDERVKQEQARLRGLGETDNAKLESKELKQRVLDQLIRERVLIQTALARGYDIADEALAPAVTNNPNFQENGKFSEQLFERFLAQQRMSRAQFFQSLKREALVDNLMGVPLASSFVPKSAAERLAGLLAEQREVSKAVVATESFLSRAKVDDSAIEAYYHAHPELSRVAEQAKVEYVVFSPDALLGAITLSEADSKAYYEQHVADYSTPEQREVAHILIRSAAGASAADKQAAEAKVAEVLKKAQADSKNFGELARQYSEDPVSASRGGNLGLVAPGSIFPAVEKLASEMKPGEVRGPVQSPAGYHIVLLKSLKPGAQRSFEEVKDLVAEGARRQLAMRRFNEEAEKFGDLVYAQSDSLKPAAEQYRLKVQASDWLPRTGGEGAFKNERLLNALFSDEAIKQKRNTEAIEVAPNTLVAARIAEYKPAGQRPLAELRAEIGTILRREQAGRLAVQQGESDLAELRQGRPVASLKFGRPAKLDRQGVQGFAEAETRAAFQLPAKALPGYAGVAGDAGYTILRVAPASVAPERAAEMAQMVPVVLQRGYATLLGEAYVDSLKQHASINVRNELLEKAER
jgi:peptidyl-prolyl cis-trans isomerase D